MSDRENELTERAINRWLRAEGGVLNQPARDYCGVVELGKREYVHVGNSYHTFAIYRVTADARLVRVYDSPKTWARVRAKVYA
jgi:hypothetical protein